MNCWAILGIECTDDKRAIKRAYAQLLKQTNPEDNPVEFQRIRDAYDSALDRANGNLGAISFQNNAFNADSAEATNSSTIQINFDPNLAAGFEARRHGGRRESQENKTPDSVKREQAERIRVFVSELIKLHRDDATKTLEYYQNSIKDDFFVALDVRYELEQQLIARLAHENNTYVPLLEELALSFNWVLDVDKSELFVKQRFPENHALARDYRLLLDRYIRELSIISLREFLEKWHPEKLTVDFLQLRRVLFENIPENQLISACEDEQFRDLLEFSIKFLNNKKYISRSCNVIGKDRLSWFYHNLAGVHDKLEYLFSRKKPVISSAGRENQTSIHPFAGLIIALIIIRGFFYLIQELANAG